MKFFPMGFFEELEKDVKGELSWEDIKIGCPCNNSFCHVLLHQNMPEDVLCNSTGFKCEAIACPMLYWLSIWWEHKENLFKFLERKLQ